MDAHSPILTTVVISVHLNQGLLLSSQQLSQAYIHTSLQFRMSEINWDDSEISVFMVSQTLCEHLLKPQQYLQCHHCISTPLESLHWSLECFSLLPKCSLRLESFKTPAVSAYVSVSLKQMLFYNIHRTVFCKLGIWVT